MPNVKMNGIVIDDTEETICNTSDCDEDEYSDSDMDKDSDMDNSDLDGAADMSSDDDAVTSDDVNSDDDVDDNLPSSYSSSSAPHNSFQSSLSFSDEFVSNVSPSDVGQSVIIHSSLQEQTLEEILSKELAILFPFVIWGIITEYLGVNSTNLAFNECKKLFVAENYDELTRIFLEYNLDTFLTISEEDNNFKSMVIKNTFEERLCRYVYEVESLEEVKRNLQFILKRESQPPLHTYYTLQHENMTIVFYANY